MTLATLIPLGLRIGVVLTVLALGLSASWHQAAYLLHHPGLLTRSLLSLFLVVPLAAVAMVTAFALRPVVEITLVALAVSPIPPMLPNRVLKAGGRLPIPSACWSPRQRSPSYSYRWPWNCWASFSTSPCMSRQPRWRLWWRSRCSRR